MTSERSHPSDAAEIREVGLRDGLQSLDCILPTSAKLAWVERAYTSGIRHIEVGSFVPPKLLPQLADTADVVAGSLCYPDLIVAALAPNRRGARRAFESGVRHLVVPVSATESHSHANLRRPIARVLEDLEAICADRPDPATTIEVSLSMAFGCPVEGKVSSATVASIAARAAAAGVDEVRLADTVGIGNPAQLKTLVADVRTAIGCGLLKGVHLHNTRGQSLAMVTAALDLGLRSFDASLGGIGGCPFAAGASGNVVTEDLAWLLDQMGFSTGIDIDRLLDLRMWLAGQLPGQQLYGFLAQAPQATTDRRVS